MIKNQVPDIPDLDTAPQASERTYRRQIEVLVRLQQSALQLLAAANTQQVASIIAQTAQAVTRACQASLYLWNTAGDRLELWARYPEKAFAGGFANRLALHVVRTGQPRHIVAPSARYPKIEFEAWACLPIRQAGRVLGVLSAVFDNPQFYTATEIQALNWLVEQAAAALERKPLDDRLYLELDRLQTMLNTTQDAMFLFDQRGRLVSANRAAEQMTDGASTAWLGRGPWSWQKVFDPTALHLMTGYTPAELRVYWRSVQRYPTQITHRQFEQVRSDSVYYIDEIGLPVSGSDRLPDGWLLIWRDISEAHQRESLRQEFSQMVIHDLRNPLTALISSMTMLQDYVKEDNLNPTLFAEVLQVAQSTGQDMLQLIQSLLDMTRLEQGAVVLDGALLSFAEIAGHAWASVRVLAAEAGIDLTLDVPDNLPDVWVDAEKIHRVLINLLDNALRHTPAGGWVRLEAGLARDQAAVTVRVIDSGPGVPAEARSRIFEKFAQLDSHLPGGYKGIGLGLAFCKLAVEAHHGTIWVEAAPGGGATFCFTLPLAPPPA